MAGRFIKLYDKILSWEWYKDINTFRLFLHLLLRANYKDMRFEGRLISRGQLVTSLASLSSETGLTQRQVRVSLDRLKMTGEVSSLTCPRYRIITISKYDEYQSDGRLNVSQTAGEMSPSCQAHDKLVTGSRQAHDSLMTTSIEYIEQKEGIEKVEPIESVSAKRFAPPTVDQVAEYCRERGNQVNPQRFVDYYTSNGWKVGRQQMKDWKAAVRTWEERDRKEGKQAPVRSAAAQQYEQRDYSEREETMEEVLMRLQREGYC